MAGLGRTAIPARSRARARSAAGDRIRKNGFVRAARGTAGHRRGRRYGPSAGRLPRAQRAFVVGGGADAGSGRRPGGHRAVDRTVWPAGRRAARQRADQPRCRGVFPADRGRTRRQAGRGRDRLLPFRADHARRAAARGRCLLRLRHREGGDRSGPDRQGRRGRHAHPSAFGAPAIQRIRPPPVAGTRSLRALADRAQRPRAAAADIAGAHFAARHRDAGRPGGVRRADVRCDRHRPPQAHQPAHPGDRHAR